MKSGFKKTEQEVFDKLRNDESQMHPYFVNEFRSLFKTQACQGLVQQFNKAFFKDDQGQLRHWPEMDEG